MKSQRSEFVWVLGLALATACSGGGTSTSPASSGTGSTGSTGGTGSTGSTTPATNQIIASNAIAFNPTTLTVAKGTDVTFTFQDITHNVTFDGTSGAPSNIGNTANGSVVRTFATAGTFGYQCTIHPGMRGTVIVN
jgi:plastocyanin